MSSEEPADRLPERQALCALLDGDATEADLACRAWREDPQARADWHAYNLIADVMRSDDVRCAPTHDARFLTRLRERLAAEPVALAPKQSAVPVRHTLWRHAWAAPMAIAAGFVGVAGVVVVAGVAAPIGAPAERSATMDSALTVPAVEGRQAVAAAPVASAALSAGGEGVLIRNAELDRYLAAHKQYSNTSALAVPGGAVRDAATAVPGR